MKRGDIPLLNQLVKTIEESIPKLEKSYEESDYEKFRKLKKIIIESQNKIVEIIAAP
jgi:hypothetical protein